MLVNIWQRFSIAIPDNMTRDQFIEYLEENDPNISLQDNSGIEYICDTERPLKTEIYEDDILLKTWDNE